MVPKATDWRWVITGGFFQALSVCGIVLSLLFIPGPVTITIIFLHTLMLLLFLAFKGERKLTFSALGSSVLALIGIGFVVNVWQGFGSVSLTGSALAFVAALATTSRLYVFGHQVIERSPAQVGGWVFAAATLFTIPIILWQQPLMPASYHGWSLLAGCCLSLIIGTFLMFYGIAALGSFEYSLLSKLEPIFAAVFSVVLLGEVLAPSQYLGMVIVLAALSWFQLSQRGAQS